MSGKVRADFVVLVAHVLSNSWEAKESKSWITQPSGQRTGELRQSNSKGRDVVFDMDGWVEMRRLLELRGGTG